MRKTLGLVGLIGIAAMAAAQLSGSTKLAEMSKALLDAKSVKATFTVQTIGSPSSSYDVALKKPNLARIESPTQIVVANGTELTVFNKAEKAYSKAPQSDAELQKLFTPDELALFSGFFNQKAYPNVSSKDLPARTVKGETMDVVETIVTPSSGKVITYFLNQTDHVARKSQIDRTDQSGKTTTVVDTKAFTLNGEIPASAFQFVAPNGAREVKPEELNARWLTDLDEAKALAARTNRKIFVDFYAEWCGPCKRLEADCFGTPEFKALSKKVVFLRIDVDKQPKVSQDYGIEAMPTQMVLAANGSVINKTVGYADKSTFFSWIYGVVGR